MNTINTLMRSATRAIAVAACAVLISGIFVSTAAAQSRGADITLRELQVFDNFLDSHPAIDRDLRQNPTSAKDPAYLSAHPELKTFLQTHPGVQDEINKSPRFFVRREQVFDRSNRDITIGEVRRFDAFLDEHRNIESDIEKNPALIRDADYLAKHPELRDFLKTHPAVAADLRENPRAFMWRERMLDREQRGRGERGGDRGTAARGNNPEAPRGLARGIRGTQPRGDQPAPRGNPEPRGNARGRSR